jgi:transcriptional regulator with XRE-family HTH domain
MMTIGERIKERRIELGLSQDELAKRVGYKSRSSINKIETSRSLPASKITLMARALDTTESSLMGWDEPRLDAKIRPVHCADKQELFDMVEDMDDKFAERILEYAKFITRQEKPHED